MILCMFRAELMSTCLVVDDCFNAPLLFSLPCSLMRPASFRPHWGCNGRRRRGFRAKKKPDARVILTCNPEFLLVAGQARFREIEITLDPSQSFIVDLLRVTQRDNRFPLNLKGTMLKPLINRGRNFAA